MRDLKSNIEVKHSLAPAARTATANGTGVDVLGAGSVTAVVHNGNWQDGTFTPTLEESSDNSSFTEVASTDLIGSFSAIDGNAEDNLVERVGYIGTKRYVRVTLTQSASPSPSNGTVTGAVIILGHESQAPAA